MFPHTITIYHHSIVDGADVYEKTVVSGCYWSHQASRAGAGKGTEKTDSYTIIFSPEVTALYGKTWSVFTGDKITLGSALADAKAGSAIAGYAVVGVQGAVISSWKDLKGDVMTVRVVEENVCGSSVDNITLIG